MTAPGVTSHNVAGEGATVGAQAQTIHGDVHVYTLASGASPKEKYEVGVRYLDGGMPTRARELIDEAVIGGHRSGEVHFHWLLAMLSGRTLQQIPEEELSMLRAAPKLFLSVPDDAWTDGVRVIERLLGSPRTPDADATVVEKELDQLDEVQRDMIIRHLELLLTGPAYDRTWTCVFEQARSEQTGGERLDRVWQFFHPTPAGARVRWPDPVVVTVGDWVRCGAATVLLAVGTGILAALSGLENPLGTVVGLLLAGLGGTACVRNGLEWRFRLLRVRAKDEEYLGPGQPAAPAPADGFADKIDRDFRRYFALYAPDDVERGVWLARTAGIRRAMRNEVVEIYRESRIGADQVAWLVRFLVGDVKRRWRTGGLYAHREELRTGLRVQAATVAGAAALGTGVLQLAASALSTRPLATMAAIVLVVAGGRLSLLAWPAIVLERRRFAAELADAERRLAERRAAFDRWSEKLSRRPSDAEMADWLDCDRKVLLDLAMRHYRLRPSKVIAHAVLVVPGAPHPRARELNGPWRYLRYTLHLFLLTEDGVRQLTADLDFEKATFHDRRRLNYRFDAVAAVRVTEPDRGQKVVVLTLVDGQPISITVPVEDSEAVEDAEDDPRIVSAVTLDTAGLRRTLHVLEGVAAEGKEWIRHERRREESRLGNLADFAPDVTTSSPRPDARPQPASAVQRP